MTKIDTNKKYITREGKEVRIYAVHEGQGAGVHGAIWEGIGWRVFDWHGNGMCFSSGEQSDYDLIEE